MNGNAVLMRTLVVLGMVMVLRGTVAGTTDARTVGNTAILFSALQSSMFSRAAIAALRSFPILIGVRLPLFPGRR